MQKKETKDKKHGKGGGGIYSEAYTKSINLRYYLEINVFFPW